MGLDGDSVAGLEGEWNALCGIGETRKLKLEGVFAPKRRGEITEGEPKPSYERFLGESSILSLTECFSFLFFYTGTIF